MKVVNGQNPTMGGVFTGGHTRVENFNRICSCQIYEVIA